MNGFQGGNQRPRRIFSKAPGSFVEIRIIPQVTPPTKPFQILIRIVRRVVIEMRRAALDQNQPTRKHIPAHFKLTVQFMALLAAIPGPPTARSARGFVFFGFVQRA
jgi:hypothetical protein